MALLASLVSRLSGLTPLATRLSAKIVGDPMRYLVGKPFERKLLQTVRGVGYVLR